jgi:exodeoxyribonuclease VII small subunit
MPSKDLKYTFESALERLDQIVSELESESISLERSLELFAEGKRLAQLCEAQLAEAEEKVKTLISTPEGFDEAAGLKTET